MLKLCLVIGLTMATLGLAGASTSAVGGQAGGSDPKVSTPESVAAGQAIYQRHCRGCHGEKGEGGPQAEATVAPSNLVDATWDHGATDDAIFKNIKAGIAPDYAMEPWGDRLKDADVWHLVHYIRSLSAPQK